MAKYLDTSQISSELMQLLKEAKGRMELPFITQLAIS